MVSVEDFKLMAGYYLEAAPTDPLPQEPRKEIAVGLKQFAFEAVRFRHEPPSTTLVHISQPTGQIHFGGDASKTLNILDAAGKLVDFVKVDLTIPSSFPVLVLVLVPASILRGRGRGRGRKNGNWIC